MAGTCGFCLGEYPGEVDRYGRHVCATVTTFGEGATIPERTADGHPQVWLLYRPEPFEFDSDDNRSIHLWMRRCDVFTSRDAASAHLGSLLGHPVNFQPYNELFPELWIYREHRSSALEHRWLLCPTPLNPPGGQR